MKTPFFITGLPRSRTAWMSAFLSNGDVVCRHEALKYCKSKADFSRLMRHPKKRVGTADSVLMWSDFRARFPNAPFIIIDRNPNEVCAALEQIETRDFTPHPEALRLWHPSA